MKCGCTILLKPLYLHRTLENFLKSPTSICRSLHFLHINFLICSWAYISSGLAKMFVTLFLLHTGRWNEICMQLIHKQSTHRNTKANCSSSSTDYPKTQAAQTSSAIFGLARLSLGTEAPVMTGAGADFCFSLWSFSLWSYLCLQLSFGDLSICQQPFTALPLLY